METCNMQDNATKEDIRRLEVHIDNAHKRIDNVNEHIVEMNQEVGKISGCMSLLVDNVRDIKEHFTASSSGNSKLTADIMKTVQILIIAVAAMGAIWTGVNTITGTRGDTSIEVKR